MISLLFALSLTLGPVEAGHEVSTNMWGIFFEDINWAADGGIYPELIRNRGFDTSSVVKANSRDNGTWQIADGWVEDCRGNAAARISRKYGQPLYDETAPYVRIEVLSPGDGAGVKNSGYAGVSVKEGVKYNVKFYARSLTGYAGDIVIELKDGDEVVKATTIPAIELKLTDKWNVYEGSFVSPKTVGNKGTFSILANAKGTLDLEFVSLKPAPEFTYKGHGLRKDLCEALEALHPKFIRFPGGCIVESQDFQHWYDWKRTVGPEEAREVVWNRWGYWQTFGLGYFEYFQLCEDLGAEPLPICLAGVTCQYQRPEEYVALADVDYFAQNILDLIEFANGDVETKWGKVRAEMGHPAPFNLKMVGVGNENWGNKFLDRYEAIVKIIAAAHPEIKIVGSSGPSPSGKDFDLAWQRATDKTAWVIDEHYYRDAEFFRQAYHRYDNYAREGKPGVYAGEYACHDKKARDNKEELGSNETVALYDAVAMLGFERNGDIVKMASYAPLFARKGHYQWKPDLIWFDEHNVYLTPNYEVQKFFANHPVEWSIPCTDDGLEAAGVYYSAGLAGGKLIIKFVNLSFEEKVVEIVGQRAVTLPPRAYGIIPDITLPNRAN